MPKIEGRLIRVHDLLLLAVHDDPDDLLREVLLLLADECFPLHLGLVHYLGFDILCSKLLVATPHRRRRQFLEIQFLFEQMRSLLKPEVSHPQQRSWISNLHTVIIADHLIWTPGPVHLDEREAVARPAVDDGVLRAGPHTCHLEHFLG